MARPATVVLPGWSAIAATADQDAAPSPLTHNPSAQAPTEGSYSDPDAAQLTALELKAIIRQNTDTLCAVATPTRAAVRVAQRRCVMARHGYAQVQDFYGGSRVARFYTRDAGRRP